MPSAEVDAKSLAIESRHALVMEGVDKEALSRLMRANLDVEDGPIGAVIYSESSDVLFDLLERTSARGYEVVFYPQTHWLGVRVIEGETCVGTFTTSSSRRREGAPVLDNVLGETTAEGVARRLGLRSTFVASATPNRGADLEREHRPRTVRRAAVLMGVTLEQVRPRLPAGREVKTEETPLGVVLYDPGLNTLETIAKVTRARVYYLRFYPEADSFEVDVYDGQTAIGTFKEGVSRLLDGERVADIMGATTRREIVAKLGLQSSFLAPAIT